MIIIKNLKWKLGLTFACAEYITASEIAFKLIDRRKYFSFAIFTPWKTFKKAKGTNVHWKNYK